RGVERGGDRDVVEGDLRAHAALGGDDLAREARDARVIEVDAEVLQREQRPGERGAVRPLGDVQIVEAERDALAVQRGYREAGERQHAAGLDPALQLVL